MTLPVLATGVAIQAIVWRLVALGRAPFWPAVAGTWAVLGTASVLVADLACCAEVGLGVATGIGLASGAALYGATRPVVTVASRWPFVAAAVDAVYGRSQEVSGAVAWAVTLAVAVPGEELFWRGLALAELRDAIAPVAGALLGWLGSVGVAAAWGSLPFAAAAIVGGAVWTALGVWSGGVVAPLVSHLVWTACMLAWRPPSAHAKVTA
jgi:membrane protease YdiL (CAAX protease family)